MCKDGEIIMNEERLPYVSDEIVTYLKNTYTNRELLDITKDGSAEQRMGFMLGVQEIIDRLEAIATREDD